MTLEELILEAQPTIVKVARSVGGSFAGYLESEDVAQALTLWVCENEDTVRGWLEPHGGECPCEGECVEETDGNRRKMLTTFRRLARGWANEAKADRLGYSIADLHFYSKASIEELLPEIYDEDAWLPQVTISDEPRAKGNAAEGNTKLALLCDVKQSYEAGSEHDRRILRDRYIDGVDVAVLAVEAGVTPQTIQRRCDRALGRMVERLGGSRPIFTGLENRRRAVSNATAQSITHNQMEG